VNGRETAGAIAALNVASGIYAMGRPLVNMGAEQTSGRRRDAPEVALAATSTALLVALAVLVLTLVALMVSTDSAECRPLVPIPLTAQTLLLGGASLVGAHRTGRRLR
jgi:hypothetical protein